MVTAETNQRFERLRWWTLVLLLASSLLLGGASRNDVLGLILLQPLAVVCGATFLLTPGPIRWSSIRVPVLLLGALAAIMAVQLVPLPPEVWSNLPGHEPFASTATVVGIEQPWRPISLSPDLTLASMIGLVVPFAVLVGFASVSAERTWSMLVVILTVIGLSALVGLAQIAGGASSQFYFYDVTNDDSPVGFFSNRNHQAVLLAMTWPMLAVWASLPADPKTYAAKTWIALSAAVFLLPMLLITGSRAGLAIGGLGLAGTFWLWRRSGQAGAPPGRLAALMLPTALGAAICVIGATIVLSRDAALERMTGISFTEESRVQYLPKLIEITLDFFPVGTGFGSFDPLFRYYEPFEILRPTYLNHAHNDLLELVMTGGLPATVLLACFLTWLAARGVAVVRASGGGRSVMFGRLGLLMIVSLLLASIVDYPLRTPLMAALFAIACGWLAGYGERATRSLDAS